jgi:hypothetical protein
MMPAAHGKRGYGELGGSPSDLSPSKPPSPLREARGHLLDTQTRNRTLSTSRADGPGHADQAQVPS